MSNPTTETKESVLANCFSEQTDYDTQEVEDRINELKGTSLYWAAIEAMSEWERIVTDRLQKERNIPVQELKIVLYRVIKSLEQKKLTDKDHKRLEDANYIINKYSSPLDALRESPPKPIKG